MITTSYASTVSGSLAKLAGEGAGTSPGIISQSRGLSLAVASDGYISIKNVIVPFLP